MNAVVQQSLMNAVNVVVIIHHAKIVQAFPMEMLLKMNVVFVIIYHGMIAYKIVTVNGVALQS